MRSKGCISVMSDGCGFLWQHCCQRSFRFGALLLTSLWPGWRVMVVGSGSSSFASPMEAMDSAETPLLASALEAACR
jgi:hypothetical protein